MARYINIVSIVLIGACLLIIFNSENVMLNELLKAVPLLVVLNLLRVNSNVRSQRVNSQK